MLAGRPRNRIQGLGTMTLSYATSATSSWTDAVVRYVSSKVLTDLRQYQRWYGAPSDALITNYGVELSVLLVLRYVEWVEYGFRRDGRWVVSSRYEVRADGTLAEDDRAGRVSRGHDVTGASFGSFMHYTTRWKALTAAERKVVEERLPFTRVDASEPGYVTGSFTYDRSYSSSGTGLARRSFTPR